MSESFTSTGSIDPKQIVAIDNRDIRPISLGVAERLALLDKAIGMTFKPEANLDKVEAAYDRLAKIVGGR